MKQSENTLLKIDEKKKYVDTWRQKVEIADKQIHDLATTRETYVKEAEKATQDVSLLETQYQKELYNEEQEEKERKKRIAAETIAEAARD